MRLKGPMENCEQLFLLSGLVLKKTFWLLSERHNLQDYVMG